MHVHFTPRQRRSASIVLGATLAAATLVACGDEQPAATQRQLRTADDIYRPTATSSGQYRSTAGSIGVHPVSTWPRSVPSAPLSAGRAEERRATLVGSTDDDAPVHDQHASPQDGDSGAQGDASGAHDTVAHHSGPSGESSGSGEGSHSTRGGFGGYHGFSHGS